MNASSQPQTANRIECLCGCGQTTSAKANYRPGHDAAHVSNLLAELLVSGDISQNAVTALAKRLPSLPLQVKFQRAVDNYAARKAARPSARQARTEWVDCDTDDYKVGRWTYPVQVKMYREGVSGLKPGQESEYLDFRRNTKRDGSGEWVKLEGGELIGR
ncbi:hypothetical protein SEA_THERESITA_57 [Microbacterium phage Theresita]|nr:hypothetical protein SEA_THERESITA_57 [Microbacterium phage Theresita]